MSNTTLSPNMGLVIPSVGVDPGPDWANNLNADLSILDSHDHTPGFGVQITPSGLNINADLPLNENNLTLIRSLRLSPQAAALSLATDIGCLYEAGVDLYYNDGNGNQIRITQGGNISGAAGTITGLPSGTASASYAAGTFVFQSATSTSANIDGGSFVLRNNSASSKGLTLAPPNAMAANYGLVLPALPGAQSFMALDTSGNMTASIAISGGITASNIASQTITAAKIASQTITATQIANQTITATQIADNTITRTQLAAVGQQVSSSSGAFTTTSTAGVSVTNLSVTLTTTGRPVMLMITSDNTGNPGYIGLNTAVTGSANFTFARNASAISVSQLEHNTAFQEFLPPSCLVYLDVIGAGTYTYTLQAKVNNSANTAYVNNCFLVAYEL